MVVVLYLCAGAVMLAGFQLLLELTGFGPPWQVVPRMWRRPVPPVAAGLVAVFESSRRSAPT